MGSMELPSRTSVSVHAVRLVRVAVLLPIPSTKPRAS